MQIWKSGDRDTRQASADYFSGTVLQEPIIEAPEPARLRALKVQFAPGARTAWHTHPLGQTLHITQGRGFVCRRGERPVEVRAGDTVFFAPGEEHWHGASPDTPMTHIAMQEALDGRVADWLEHVTDAEYTTR